MENVKGIVETNGLLTNRYAQTERGWVQNTSKKGQYDNAIVAIANIFLPVGFPHSVRPGNTLSNDDGLILVPC